MYFLADIICSTKISDFEESTTYLFFLLLLMFLVSYLRKCCLIQGLEDYSYVLALTLRFLIHFELTFVFGVR